MFNMHYLLLHMLNKNTWGIKVRGQSEAGYKQADVTKSFDINRGQEVKILLTLSMTYCKRGNFHWAKLSRFSRFFRGLRKFSHEYFALSIKNKCPGLVPRKYNRENPYI